MRAAILGLLFLCGCATSRLPLRDVAADSGLSFTHNPGAKGEFHMTEIMGSGAALIDYDNDGDLDVYFVQSTGGTNRLFRNELIPAGALRFTDVTAKCRCGAAAYGMGAATGDFDGDGFTDLYVTNFGPNILYRNNGDGTFSDVTATAGAGDPRWSTSAVFADYDRDGDADLFVLNYTDFALTNRKNCYAASGELDYCTPRAYNPVNASLFRNEGAGRFADVSAAAGIAAARGPGLGVLVADANDDGWPDFFVANDSMANLLWINQRDGTFKDQALVAGTAYSEDGLAKAGMGIAAADFDNDGDDDLLVANLAREGATLFRCDGPMLYQDASLATAIRPLTFSHTGFGLGWIDYDNDSWPDVFVANGAVTIMEEQRGQPYPFGQQNLLLHNGGGRRFSAVAAFEAREVARGAAFGDLDNDGDTDIVVNNNNGPARLFLNEVGHRNAWLRIGWKRTPPAGTRVGLRLNDGRTLWRRAHTDGSYLSASDPRVLFGLGNAAPPATLVIDVPGKGRRESPVTRFRREEVVLVGW